VEFDKKTEFSKSKYLKRKKAKYLQRFTVLEATWQNLCEAFYQKNPAKIRSMRTDTLSTILTIANIRTHAKVLVVDDVNGLVVAAVLSRMNGSFASCLIY
jgi:tRNA (adenine-N(1)-)-methyltransferase non-catalytic subunit